MTLSEPTSRFTTNASESSGEIASETSGSGAFRRRQFRPPSPLLKNRGSIGKALMGSVIILVLTNGLILVGVSDIWQFIVKGLVILVAVGLIVASTSGAC